MENAICNLELQVLTKIYSAKKATKKALAGVSFTLGPGLYGLLGPNGAGKSTMMNIITGNLDATSGKVLWNGKNVLRMGREFRRVLGYMPQQQNLYDSFTGRRFLLYIAALKEIPRSDAALQVQRVAELVHLSSELEKRLAAYSGGMKRRLDIAMSLMSDPQVLFLDEPTTGLDPGSRRQSWEAIRQLSASGTTVFLTTQYLEEAELLADQIAVLHEGKIITTGTPEQLKGRFSHEKLRFHFAHARFVRQAAAILADFRPHSDAQTLELRVQRAETMTLLTHVLTRLHQAHIMPVRFEQARPSLEDAFLQMIEREREAHER